jgi:hypothetical protein
MYAQVYYHKTVRAAEWMFILAMRRFADLARAGREPPGLPLAARQARGEALSVAEYLGLDDARLTCALEDWSRCADPVLGDLSRRFLARRLFKTVEVADAAAAEGHAAALAGAAAEVFGEGGASYWAVDRARWQGYDPRPGEEIYVVGHPRHGTLYLGRLQEELPVARPSATARIVCAPELRERFAEIVGGKPAQPGG